MGEIAMAVSEWLSTIKDRMEGHDKFQLAVARNALGILARDDSKGRFTDIIEYHRDQDVCRIIFAAERTLADGDFLDMLRIRALASLEVDMPKYPALQAARKLWFKED